MSEPEERPREQESNPTQERMDDKGTEQRPVDVEWDEPSPHEGEEDQDIV